MHPSQRCLMSSSVTQTDLLAMKHKCSRYFNSKKKKELKLARNLKIDRPLRWDFNRSFSQKNLRKSKVTAVIVLLTKLICQGLEIQDSKRVWTFKNLKITQAKVLHLRTALTQITQRLWMYLWFKTTTLSLKKSKATKAFLFRPR